MGVRPVGVWRWCGVGRPVGVGARGGKRGETQRKRPVMAAVAVDDARPGEARCAALADYRQAGVGLTPENGRSTAAVGLVGAVILRAKAPAISHSAMVAGIATNPSNA